MMMMKFNNHWVDTFDESLSKCERLTTNRKKRKILFGFSVLIPEKLMVKKDLGIKLNT